MILEIVEQEKRVHKFFDVNDEYNLKPLDYIETVIQFVVRINTCLKKGSTVVNVGSPLIHSKS